MGFFVPTSFLFFLAVVLAVAVQRLYELRLSARNEAALRARGAVEAAPGQMPWMRALHTLWLVAMPIEVLVFNRPFVPWLAGLALAGVVTGQLLRYAAIRALGERWTVKIIVLPGMPPVSRGLFSRIRHPNYLGVVLEIAFLPLLHGAWGTALVFSLLNGWLLRHRIAAEERALAEANDYERTFADRPRFVPRG